ncbi:MAG: hypothetical protein PUA55_03435 [Mycoplasma sp.]|nr:hypothetical protein [Mycoplasma sp.]
MNGTIILIRGNHDRKSVKFYEKIGFKVLTNAPIILEKYKLMLSHVPLPDSKIKEGYINLHGYIHNKSISEDYSDEKHINLSVDVTGYKPVSIDECEDYVKKKIECEKICKKENCSLDDLHYENFPEKIVW